jgi:Zn-dependent protease/CBS domain-containing protein
VSFPIPPISLFIRFPWRIIFFHMQLALAGALLPLDTVYLVYWCKYQTFKEDCMFGRRITLFTLFGFEVRIDLSWIFIAVLVAWSLSVGFFPFRYKNLSTQTYWFMGIIGAFGLFASIIVHEFAHSLVARRYGLPMKGITLFIFGGVAEMEEEPESAKVEFMMAIVGPLTSILLALIFYGISLVGAGVWPEPVNGVISYLALINGILAVFNLIPAFPLDGGRVLRSVLWATKKNIRAATRITSNIGTGFGVFLIIMGVFSLFTGNLIGGLWWILIGIFLQSAAKMGYQQLITRKILEGEPVSRFMKTNPITVAPSTTIRDLVENYIYRYHFKLFPVVEGERLLGCITTREVKNVPQDQWEEKTVEEVATGCKADNTISPDADAMHALSAMNRTGLSRLMVTEGSRLVGIIALKDLMRLLALKVELEQENEDQ